MVLPIHGRSVLKDHNSHILQWVSQSIQVRILSVFHSTIWILSCTITFSAGSIIISDFQVSGSQDATTYTENIGKETWKNIPHQPMCLMSELPEMPLSMDSASTLHEVWGSFSLQFKWIINFNWIWASQYYFWI